MISIENWADTTIKMRTLGVELPPEDECINPAFKPTLFVATRLMRDTSEFGASVSYIHPNIEQNAAPTAREFAIEFPEQIMLIAHAVKALGGRVVLVGGCIRDLLYDLVQGTRTEPKDFDIEVYGLDFDTLNKMLSRIFPGCKISNEGKSYGITKVYAGLAEPIDVAIPREEFSTGDGNKEFDCNMSPRMPYEVGIRRRDLRFNSAIYDPIRKVLYDPYAGEVDLQKREINVTDPETFVEDPLRVLRIMQFIGRFETKPTDPTVELCKKMALEGKLDTLSADRIRDELIKLLKKSKNPSTGLQFAKEIGFIRRAWPELNALVEQASDTENLWAQSLQAVDAAALIAKRERLDDDTKVLLTLTSLCFYMDKQNSTGTNTSQDQMQSTTNRAPAAVFLKRLNLTNTLQAEVLSLLPKVESLVELFNRETAVTSFAQSASVDPDIKRLARKLFDETKLYLPLLMLLVEASHDHHDTAQHTLIGMKKWFAEKIVTLELTQKPPKQLFDNAAFLTALALKAGGPWLGVIEICVRLDQDENIITTTDEALARGHYYFAQLQKIVGENESCIAKKHFARWGSLLRYEDPRQQL